MAGCSGLTGSFGLFRSSRTVGSGLTVGAGLAGQWLGQFAVRWAAENIQLFF